MFTAARLFGSIFFAVAAVGAIAVAQHLVPEIAEAGEELVSFIAVLGLFVGWISLGRRVNDPEGGWFGDGVTSAVVMAIYTVALLAAYHVYDQMQFRRFADPRDVLFTIAEKSVEYTTLMLDWRVLLVAAVGAMLSAYFARFIGYFWN
ncbi:MAG: TrgA family protein [Pseudomonadota bacterium]